MSANTLEVRGLTVHYRTLFATIKAVNKVSFDVPKGSIVGLIGESGSGKSTLAQSLVLPKPPMHIVDGSAVLNGNIDLVKIDPALRRKIVLKKVSIIPQYVLDALPVIRKLKVFLHDLAVEKDVEPKELEKIFVERLNMMNLPEKVLDMYPLELSGGMRQRVAIAIATLFNPSLLIADEPTSALDVVSQRYVLELLKDLRDSGIVESILLISHDISSIRQIADRIVVMYGGKIVEEGSIDEIISNPLHPYTKMLIKAIPPKGIHYTTTRLEGVKGVPPNLAAPPPGCVFHPRCPYAVKRCFTDEPPVVTLANGRRVSCWLYYEVRKE